MFSEINKKLDGNEIIKSTKDNIYDKITSPLWGTFILTWIVWNWKLVYTTIFISGDKIYEKYEILKIEYIISNIYDGTYHYFNLPIFTDYLVYWFLGPILSTSIILLYIPYISNFVYIRDINIFKKNRILAKDKMEIAVLKEKQKLLKVEEKEIEKIIKLEKNNENKKGKLENIEFREWDKEYTKIINKNPDIINILSNFMYKLNGYTIPANVGGRMTNGFNDSNTVKIFHSLELINLDKDKIGHYLLTSKGKYFLKKSTLE